MTAELKVDPISWLEKLRQFRKALQAVQAFLDSGDGTRLREVMDSDTSMDPDDLEFWEYHLDI